MKREVHSPERDDTLERASRWEVERKSVLVTMMSIAVSAVVVFLGLMIAFLGWLGV